MLSSCTEQPEGNFKPCPEPQRQSHFLVSIMKACGHILVRKWKSSLFYKHEPNSLSRSSSYVPWGPEVRYISTHSRHFKPVLEEFFLAYTNPKASVSCAQSALGALYPTSHQPLQYDFVLSTAQLQHPIGHLLGPNTRNLIKGLETFCPAPGPIFYKVYQFPGAIK